MSQNDTESHWMLDPLKRSVVLELLRLRRCGISLRRASAMAGVHVATVCRWQKRDPSLRAALQDAALTGRMWRDQFFRSGEPRPHVRWRRDCPLCKARVVVRSVRGKARFWRCGRWPLCSLDVARLMREGILKANPLHSGSLTWFSDSSLREKTASIGYEVNTIGTLPRVRLFYSFAGTTDAINYRIRLVTTRPRFGELRWWFICPLVANERPCERRVGKLYLPPGGRYFGCRHCHNLTYRSAQQHDKRVDALRRNPAAVWALMYGPNASLSQKLLAVKALF